MAYGTHLEQTNVHPHRRNEMIRWGIIAALAAGAALVKESEAASRFYDTVRESTTRGLRRWITSWRPATEQQDVGGAAELDTAGHGRSVSNVG